MKALCFVGVSVHGDDEQQCSEHIVRLRNMCMGKHTIKSCYAIYDRWFTEEALPADEIQKTFGPIFLRYGLQHNRLEKLSAGRALHLMQTQIIAVNLPIFCMNDRYGYVQGNESCFNWPRTFQKKRINEIVIYVVAIASTLTRIRRQIWASKIESRRNVSFNYYSPFVNKYC